jgi:hypothetical protein
MRVLIDTDVILDVIQNRQPFSIEAQQIWNANRLKKLMVLLLPSHQLMYFISSVNKAAWFRLVVLCNKFWLILMFVP